VSDKRETSPLRKPLDAFPKVWVIMARHPNKNRITDDGIIAYGFPGQPFPGQLLHRGPGMAFRTREDARQHLQRSLARDADCAYVKTCRFEITPVYLPWAVRRVQP
jgi:hypothetical protein